MQREFSKELAEDRDFEIGKEVFTWRYPHWKEAGSLFDEELKPEPENGKAPEFSFVADTEMAIERIPMFLEGGAATKKRWLALVNRKEEPIPRHQIVQLYRWLLNVSSGLPTNPPSDSVPGGGDSDTSSPGESS
jgi:hypothetical protein